MCCQRERCESLSFHSFFEENNTAGNGQASVRVEWCRKADARCVTVSPEVLETLHDQIGFSWAEIARNIGICESTICRRRRSLGVGSTNSRSVYSAIGSDDLDQIVRSALRVTPRIGYRLVQGSALRRRGLHIQRRSILAAGCQRVVPVTITIRCSRSIIRRRLFGTMPKCIVGIHVSTIHSIIFRVLSEINSGEGGRNRGKVVIFEILKMEEWAAKRRGSFKFMLELI